MCPSRVQHNEQHLLGWTRNRTSASAEREGTPSKAIMPGMPRTGTVRSVGERQRGEARRLGRDRNDRPWVLPSRRGTRRGETSQGLPTRRRSVRNDQGSRRSHSQKGSDMPGVHQVGVRDTRMRQTQRRSASHPPERRPGMLFVLPERPEEKPAQRLPAALHETGLRYVHGGKMAPPNKEGTPLPGVRLLRLRHRRWLRPAPALRRGALPGVHSSSCSS